MKKITLTIEISEKSFELLKQLEDGKGAEFRDSEFISLEHFKESDLFKENKRTEDWFKARNFCDMLDFQELITNGFVDDGNGMAWHTTYYISDLGKQILEQNKVKQPTNIKVRIYIPVDKKTDFWYQTLNGMVYNVRECTSYDDFKDSEGLSNKEPKDCYIVIDGESETNIILKEDCKIIG